MDSHSLDLLKARIDYPALLRVLGIPFRDHPDEGVLKFRCLNPQHEDKDPSMSVRYRARGSAPVGRWHCWNHACHRWGRDVFDLVRVMRRCSIEEAVGFVQRLGANVSGADILGALAAEDIARQTGLVREPEYPVMPFPVLLPEPSRPMDPDHPYLTTVRDPPVTGRHAVEEGAVFCTEGDYQGYMVVPIRWGDGTVVTWQAIAVEPWAVERRAVRHPKAAQAKLYPPGAPIDRILYGHHRTKPGCVLVVSEGIFDVWRAWDAVALGGLDGWCPVGSMSNRLSKDQAKIVRFLHPVEVVALHDNEDDPNPPGLNLVLDLGAALGYTVPLSVASVPKGCDPDDAGAAAVLEALRNRITYGRWAALWATRPPDRPSPPSLAALL